MKKNKSYPAEFHIFWSIQVLKYVLLQAENYDYVDIWVTSLQKDEKLPIAFDHRGLTDPEIFYVFSLIMTPRPQNHPRLKRFFIYLYTYLFIYIFIYIYTYLSILLSASVIVNRFKWNLLCIKSLPNAQSSSNFSFNGHLVSKWRPFKHLKFKWKPHLWADLNETRYS